MQTSFFIFIFARNIAQLMELIIWISREGTHTRQPHDNYRRYELRDGKMRLHDYRHSLRATDLLAFVHRNGSNVDSSFIFLWWIVVLARTFPLVHKAWKCHPPTPPLGLIIEFEELQTSPLFGLSTANSDLLRLSISLGVTAGLDGVASLLVDWKDVEFHWKHVFSWSLLAYANAWRSFK